MHNFYLQSLWKNLWFEGWTETECQNADKDQKESPRYQYLFELILKLFYCFLNVLMVFDPLIYLWEVFQSWFFNDTNSRNKSPQWDSFWTLWPTSVEQSAWRPESFTELKHFKSKLKACRFSLAFNRVLFIYLFVYLS